MAAAAAKAVVKKQSKQNCACCRPLEPVAEQSATDKKGCRGGEMTEENAGIGGREQAEPAGDQAQQQRHEGLIHWIVVPIRFERRAKAGNVLTETRNVIAF